ncbi:hypothetical protein ABIB82_007461 [Bradyrhizobium sp. i1.8.4]|uniref:hypothetical protein n=1 Tax=unclassified Bradyrhizobium TaxID=2631580 RepID=UPI003D2491AC
MTVQRPLFAAAKAGFVLPAWFWLGAGVYALLLVNGNALLNDSDTHWHIAVGKWILDHNALPRVDTYSFTKAGEPWISTSWLAQVLYAGSFETGGWSGPIILAAACIAGTFAFLAFILGRRIRSIHAIIIALVALAVSASHFLARPHVLALPVMLAWVNGLVGASERREPPSFWLLPLMTLWANLHGGFVFGLALILPIAFDALWNAEVSQRGPLALRWIVFGACAFAACCATPYGWGSILAARKILALGELLNLISEWSPADFSHFSMFEGSILALIAGSLYFGLKLSPPRILLVLGLFHMALSHARNVDIFACLLPLVVLTPVSSQFGLQADRTGKMIFPTVPAAMLIAAFGVSTWVYAANHKFSPPLIHSPAAAIDVLKLRGAKRVLNDYPFGGYLISEQMPVFIDSRAELYGEQFVMAYFRALQLKDVNQFLGLLKEYEIDAVLLMPATPAAGLLDHLDGWQRAYSDETAVVHIRNAGNSRHDGAFR